jgi:hypothetical protein
MTTATLTPVLCARCKAARAASHVHTTEFAERTTPDYRDAPADRDHHIRITVWAACTGCSGRTR